MSSQLRQTLAALAPNKKESFITSSTEIHILHSQWVFCFVSPMLLTSPHISSPTKNEKNGWSLSQNLSTLFKGSIFLTAGAKKKKPLLKTENPKTEDQLVCCSPNFLGFFEVKNGVSRSRTKMQWVGEMGDKV